MGKTFSLIARKYGERADRIMSQRAARLFKKETIQEAYTAHADEKQITRRIDLCWEQTKGKKRSW